jgi:hypothetical protein
MSRRTRHYVYKVEAFEADGTKYAYTHRALRVEAFEDARVYLDSTVGDVSRVVVSKRIDDSKKYTPVYVFDEDGVEEVTS